MAIGQNVAETVIGAVVLVAAGGFLVYAANTADLAIGGGSGYPLVAEFRKAEGLSVGGDVRISGVKVGSVAGMELNPRNYFARVTLTVDGAVEVPDDSLAKITSDGLLGATYVALEPGGSDIMLESGEEFGHTQGSVNITELVGRAVQGIAPE